MANTDKNAFQRYLHDIGTEKKLSDEEELRLAHAIREGEKEAIDQLLSANLKYVIVVARQYLGRGLPMDELVAEGNLGMMEAAPRFDGRSGKRFVTFAAPYIRRTIESALREHVGMNGEYGAGASSEDTRKRNISRSVDAPIPAGSQTGYTLLAVLENMESPKPDLSLQLREQRDDLQRLAGMLDEREQQVVKAFFGMEGEVLSMSEIAQNMGLKRERVRQIRDKALRKLLRLSKKE